MPSSATAKKIATLVKMAQDLRQGEHFNITRLTSMKSLCADPDAAGQFCLHLAKLTKIKLNEKMPPNHLEAETWLKCKGLVSEAITGMTNYLSEPTEESKDSLQKLLSRVQAVNNKYKNQAWGPIRVIQSSDVLLVEKALYGVLQPSESSQWGYQIAREYAERYHPSYGNGLIPDSALLIEDIADFWCQYHFDKPLSKWLDTSKS